MIGLLPQGNGDGHVGRFEDRIPARLLVLTPAPDALAMGRPSCMCDLVGKVTSSLAERKPAQAFAWSRQIPPGVKRWA